ncbi:LuxR family transcriptional regulator [Streptomyces sp. YIM 98790]|uniref:helix-turn-helix transcriptional regulator n=1 Tax=Streptomyces sp. YIM 98790 TaxID=2689077 RepID=UPI0014082128|nr:LuxR family transcriptional regulator [Streptomyces sp. YIM 98790]
MGQAEFTTGLAERDAAFEQLDQALALSTQGQCSVAVVSGPLASGKTALLHAFSEYAAESGATVLSASASRAEQSFPLGVLEQLFQNCEACAPHIRRAIKFWMDGNHCPMAAEEEFRNGQQLTLKLARTTYDALLGLAARTPVVLVIDDAQYTDTASLQCVLHFIRRLKSARVLVVLSEGDHLAQLPRRFRAEILRHPSCTEIPVELLSQDGVASVLASALSPAAAQRLSPVFHQLSGGNPMLLRGLVEDSQGRPTGAPDRPQTDAAYRRAVLDLLCRGSHPPLEELARAVAILHHSATVPLLGRLTGMDDESTGQGIAALHSTGLLEHNRFRHQAARSAVLNSMGSAERRKLHSQAAHLLNESGAAATVVAPHILVSEEQQPWSVATLRTAAEQALAEGRWKTAVRYLRRAHEACIDDQQRAVLASLLMGTEWRSDPAGAARRYLPQLVSAVREGLLTGEHAVQTCRHLLWSGRADEAAETLRILRRDGAAAAGQGGGAPPLDGIRLWLLYLFPGLSAHSPDALPLPSTNLPHASVWTPQHQAVSALDAMLRNGPAEEVVSKAEQILLGTRLDDKTLLSLNVALSALIYGESLDKAAAWCASLLRDAPPEQTPMWHALFRVIQATIHYRRGELAEAERLAQTALSLVSPEGWGVGIGIPLSLLILTATAMGRYEKAATYLTVVVPETIGQTLFGALYVYARGHYHLATSQNEAALRDFHAVGGLVTAWRFDNPAILPWRSLAAHASLCVGEPERARALVQEQMALLRPGQHRAWGLSYRSRAATEPGETAIPLLQKAAELFEHLGDRLELAHTLADLSRAHHMLGERHSARATAARALDLAKRCGADPLKAILIPMTNGHEGIPVFAPFSAEPGAVSALSRAEKRVAVLAAEGHSNRQIASTLHITVSTVEQHLTRIYRKLSIKRRADIGSRLQPTASLLD